MYIFPSIYADGIFKTDNLNLEFSYLFINSIGSIEYCTFRLTNLVLSENTYVSTTL